MIKYIVWDVDGTLYKSDPALSQEIRHAYKNLLRQTWSKYRFNQLESLLKNQKKRYKSCTGALVSLAAGSYLNIAQKVENQINWSAYLKKDQRLINMFKQIVGLNHFALRNGTTGQTKKTISLLGLDQIKKPNGELGPFTRVWGTVSIVNTTKPDPLVFDFVRNYLYRTYGQFKKQPLREKDIFQFSQQILIVGDRPEVDLKPAKKLGFQTALVWTKTQAKVDYIDYHLTTVYQIPSLL